MERESARGNFHIFRESPALSGRSQSIKEECVELLVQSVSRMELHLLTMRQLALLTLCCVLVTGKNINVDTFLKRLCYKIQSGLVLNLA